MDLHYVIPYTIVAIGAVLLLAAQFGPRFRRSSLWFRLLYLVACLLGILWSGLGFFLLSHQKGMHSELPWSQLWRLDNLKSDLGGVALGIFIALLTHRESWKRRPPPTQSA